MEQYKVRRATAEDYEGVLALDPEHKIYNGHDYLPAEYHRFLQSPNIRMTLCLRDKEIVGMAMGVVVDDGETIIGMAARTSSKARGKGIWASFRQSPIENGDRITNFAGVTAQFNTFLKGKETEDYLAPQIIDKRIMINYRIESNNFAQAQKHLKDIKPTPLLTKCLSKEEALEYLLDKDIQWKLFPSKRIIFDAGMMIYRMRESNFHMIIEQALCISASLDDKNSSESIVFGDGRHVHNGYLYQFHYYGSNLCPNADIVRNLPFHLEAAMQKCEGRCIIFRVCLPSSLSHETVSEVLTTCPGFEIDVQRATIELTVFERYKKWKKSKI